MGEIIRASSEDYLEVIYHLEQENKNVKSVDVAKKMNVSRPSVNKAISVLKDAGMVSQELYGTINLTAQGRKKAVEIVEKHQTLRVFLSEVLGVSKQNADKDACEIEHIISQETFERIKRMVEEKKGK